MKSSLGGFARAAPIGVAGLVALAGLAMLGCPRSVDEPPLDAAAAAGRDAASFPQADEDHYRALDGGVALTADEVKGRNIWLLWTGGNQAMWDYMANNSFGAFDLLKTLSSHPSLPASRDNRAEYLGLWNEPGFEKATGPDPEHHGLWLDRRVGDWSDPFENAEKYPGVAGGSFYGSPSGIIGLRLFPNPDFDEDARRRWDAERYYDDPGYYLDRRLVRPYRVGMTCAFCHVGPSPTNPPPDPENPGWEHLSGYVGAQYFWNGRIFFYKPDPTNFVSQLFSAPRPGTLDTSFVATDNIFNPRTMNAVYSVGPRLAAAQVWGRETLSGGELDNPQLPDLDGVRSFRPPDEAWAPHVLKDGADSVGVLGALNRVYVNIGTHHTEWFRHMKPLIGGKPQTPFRIAEARERSTYWRATEDRAVNLALYFLAAARPHKLAEAPGGAALLSADEEQLARGRDTFAAHCAVCHSSKQPASPPGVAPGSPEYRDWTDTDAWRAEMLAIARADDFLEGNYLSNDRRIPVTALGTNLCSPLASNAVAGHVWNDFSSTTYKNLPGVGTVRLADPFDSEAAFDFEMPGGGRGYTRVPSLVSLWSTAPFLLNNTVGPFVADPSVDGRMRSFEASIEELLWPETRTPYVARTTATSYLKVGVAYLEPPFNTFVGFFSKLFGNGVIEVGPIPEGTPIGLLANVGLNDRSRHPQLLRLLPRIFKALARIRTENLDEAEAAALLRSEVAPGLLAASECPDFVMNRGHEFGSELPDGDKRALIEYLKTF